MVFMIVYSSPRSRSDQLVANSCTFLRIRVRSMKITRACSNANSETTGLTMREIARVLIASLSAVLIVGCTTEKPPARLNRESATTESEISPPVNAGSLAAKANELARSGDLSGATTLVKQALIQFPDDGAILELAGDLAAAKGLSKEAIDRYESALDTFSNRSSNGASSKPTSPSIQLMDKIGRQWMNLGEPYRAISQLQRMHQLDPNDTRTRRDLAGLLGSMGMERRAAEHLRFLIQHKQAGVNELVVISDLSRPQADESICNYALKSNSLKTLRRGQARVRMRAKFQIKKRQKRTGLLDGKMTMPRLARGEMIDPAEIQGISYIRGLFCVENASQGSG